MSTERDEGPAARRWRELVDRRAQQMDAAYAALQRTSGDYWARRMANRVSALRRRASDDDLLLQTVLRYATPQTTVLDVGAGAGRYSLAIAPHVASLIAVEPDVAMLPLLEEATQEAGLRNVRITPAAWQEADVPSTDLVLCSHVLYPIAGAVAFIRKLDEHASVACFLALRETTPDPEPLGRLWQQYHGEPRYLQPGFVEAFALLREMGIAPHVRVQRGPGQTWAFATVEATIDAVREHLILPQSGAMDADLRHELEATLVPDGDLLRLPAPPARIAVLWWERANR